MSITCLSGATQWISLLKQSWFYLGSWQFTTKKDRCKVVFAVGRSPSFNQSMGGSMRQSLCKHTIERDPVRPGCCAIWNDPNHILRKHTLPCYSSRLLLVWCSRNIDSCRCSSGSYHEPSSFGSVSTECNC